MSEILANKLSPSTGTAVQIGDSGDTITIPSGATFTQSGTMNASAITAGTMATARLGSGTASSSTFLRGDQTYAAPGGVSLSGSTNNTVATVTGSDALAGEANLTFDGESLVVSGNPGTIISQRFGLTLENDTDAATSGNSKTGILFRSAYVSGTTTTALSGISGGKDNNTNDNYDGFVSLNTRANGSSTMAERLRINGAGIVMINTTSTIDDYAKFQVLGGAAIPVAVFKVGSNGETIGFRNAAGSGVGSVEINSSSTAFQTSSDYRLKENETSITDGITRLKTLKPYRFNFIADNDADGNPTQTVDGFFAHEVTAVPEAISGTKDEMKPEVLYKDEVLYTAEDDLPEGISIGDVKTPADDLPEGKNIGDVKRVTEPKHQSIDQSKLVPLLTSALQEAITKIETLEAKVTALENA